MKKLSTLILSCLVYLANAQNPITTVPFEMYGDHIFLEISIDDSDPLDFIFDTGSGLTVLDKDVAKSLKLSGKEIKMNKTKTTMELIKHNKLEINGFLMEKNIKVYAAELDHLEISLGRNIDGIFGYDLMVHHTLHIDYDQQEIEIYDHGKGPVTGDMIEFDLNISIPTINATVVLNNDESLEGKFFVMTGAGTTLDFNTPFANENDIIDKTGKHFSYLVKDISEVETPHYEGQIKSLRFGEEHYENFPIGISQAKSGIQAHPEVAGIIGNRLLSVYNITIDLPNSRFLFEPNQSYGKKLPVNSAGIDIQLSKDKERLLVHKVYENSPAEEEGLLVDDHILSINGESADNFTFPEIKDILSRAGEEVSITVKRNGQEKAVLLKMRSLID